MIQVHLVLTRVPAASGLEQHDLNRAGVYLDPRRIDTVTPIDAAARRHDHLPPTVNAVIRYDDNRTGFRLLYVAEEARAVSRARRREILGEDSDTMDWGSSPTA